jgi:hypothetical protein
MKCPFRGGGGVGGFLYYFFHHIYEYIRIYSQKYLDNTSGLMSLLKYWLAELRRGQMRTGLPRVIGGTVNFEVVCHHNRVQCP